MKKYFVLILSFVFLSNAFVPSAVLANEIILPKPGVMVHLSPALNPPVLKGIKVDVNNPFKFDFVLDQGDKVSLRGSESDRSNFLKQESTKLIKYFLAAITTPEKDLWVNLSPYEKDRIVPESFGQTEMGRDLLAQDYLLKQLTASLIYPEDEIGKKFWKRVYETATTKNISVNTFNKVWIVPNKAVVYENTKNGTAYVVESSLKVLTEQDYLANSKNSINENNNSIVRDIVIPQLTKEVNEGSNFAQLRQVYNSLILATWYKKKLKDSILTQAYADKNKVKGLEHQSTNVNAIYSRYLESFKKGAYNFIKEEQDPLTKQIIPRKYFSGGLTLDLSQAMTTTLNPAMVQEDSQASIVGVDVTPDFAMKTESIIQLPKTPLEAVRQWQDFVGKAQVPNTPLHQQVPVRFWVTSKPWQNDRGDDGFYGKTLPPMKLSDGRSLVPMVGDIHEVKEFQMDWTGAGIDENKLKGYLQLATQPTFSRFQGFEKQLSDGKIFSDETLDWDGAEVIGVETLRSLLHILKENNDSELRQFMDRTNQNFDFLIGLSGPELRRLVPEALFMHADDMHWKEYEEKQTRLGALWARHNQNFWNDIHLIRSVYTGRVQRGESFFKVFAKFYKKFPQEGGKRDYLAMYFEQSKKKEDGNLSLYTLQRVLKNLFEANDPVLKYYGRQWEDVGALSREDLINAFPMWVWFRAFKIRPVAPTNEYPFALQEVSNTLADGRLDKVKTRIVVKKLGVGDMRAKGYEPVLNEQGEPESISAYTYQDVVGRLFFFYSRESGYVTATSQDGFKRFIDSSQDFLSALENGEHFTFVPGRLEFKGLGAYQPKVFRYKKDGLSAVDEDGQLKIEEYVNVPSPEYLNFVPKINAPVEVILEDAVGQRRALSAQDIAKNPGIYLDTNYQPNFPSPAGAEVEEFSGKQIEAESRLLANGGQSPYHTFSRMTVASFGSKNLVNVYGSMRISAPDSLRLNEALHEHGLDKEHSQFSQWKKSGALKDKLRNLFAEIGSTQRAMLLTGHTWILLGNRLLHDTRQATVLPLTETYKFFLNNVDTAGRQADLGDFLSLKDSLNNDDITESIAIIVTMASQLIMDLEKNGIIDKPDLEFRKELLAEMAKGLGVIVDNKEIPDSIDLTQLKYSVQMVQNEVDGEKFRQFKRMSVPRVLESFIQKLSGTIRPAVEAKFPVRKKSLSYALFERGGFDAFPKPTRAQQTFSEQMQARGIKLDAKTLDLVQQLNIAFTSQQNRVVWGNKEIALPQALEQLNQLLSSSDNAMRSSLHYYDHEDYPRHTWELINHLDRFNYYENFRNYLSDKGFTGLYIDPKIDIDLFEHWIISDMTDPRILVRRVNKNTLNVELSRTVVDKVNQQTVDHIKERIKKARALNKPIVNSVAMEMPVVFQNGKHRGHKLKTVGKGGGGEGVYMNDLSAALSKNGTAYLVTSPLFFEDIEEGYSSHTYKNIDDKIDAFLADMHGERLMEIKLPLGKGTYALTVLYYEQNGAPVIKIFDKTGHLYRQLYEKPHPDSAGGYIEAFLLPLAAIEISRQLEIQIDAFHFQDWQAALGNLILDTMYKEQQWPLGFIPGRVQTLHNFEPQGIFKGALPLDNSLYLYLRRQGVMGALPDPHNVNLFTLTDLDAYRGNGGKSLRDQMDEGLEFYSNHVPGQHRLIAALKKAHTILAVSANHLKEGLSSRGYGLEPIFQYLKAKGKQLVYVYNGIFSQNHLPENLKALQGDEAKEFGFRSPSKPLVQLSDAEKAVWKSDNKVALQNKIKKVNLQFDVNPNNVVIGITTRMVKQKGLNILAQKVEFNGMVKTLLEHILDGKAQEGGAKIQMVFLGTAGDDLGVELVKFLENFLKDHPEYADRFTFINRFDPVLAKQIGAGSDLFLMPSIDEPAGISNLEAALLLSFGIVTNRGGLVDFKEAGGTPIDLVEGFEEKGPWQVSALQILDRIKTFQVLYSRINQGDAKAQEEYFSNLQATAKFNPDWGNRVDQYNAIFLGARQLANPNMKDFGIPDSAMAKTDANKATRLAEGSPKRTGGIDLSAQPLQLQSDKSGASIDFKLDPKALKQFQKAPGLTPRILYIQPLKSVRGFLGITL